MAINYNPKIVTDGLIFYVDAANPKSYPGTGSAWNDLSENKNHVTLFGSPVFNSAQKWFEFDGVDDYGSFLGLTLSRTSSAFSVWFTVGVNHTGNYGNRGLILANVSTGGKYNNLFAIQSSVAISGETLTNEEYFTYGEVLQTGWNNVTVSFENSIAKTYVNGVLSVTSNNLTDDVSFNSISLGDATANYQGNISMVSMYNRTLSSTEVLQNFNASRGRYGL